MTQPSSAQALLLGGSGGSGGGGGPGTNAVPSGLASFGDLGESQAAAVVSAALQAEAAQAQVVAQVAALRRQDLALESGEQVLTFEKASQVVR